MSYRSVRRDPDNKGQVEQTPAEKYGYGLCKYAWRGNIKRMERCIRKGASIEFSHPLSGARPLHRAVLGGHSDAITFLLNKGARVNAVDNEEWRPLHFAASKGFTKITRQLIDRGAEVNAKDMNGNTPLHLACLKDNPGVVCVLVAAGADVRVPNVEDKQCRELAMAPGSRVLDALDGLIELADQDMQPEEERQREWGEAGGEGAEEEIDEGVIKDRQMYGIVLDDE